MTPLDTLSSEIKMHLDRQESTGWYSCHCPVCNETRTRTGGFLFTDDSITYNCFRGKCDATCGMSAGEYISKKFKHLMQCMGVKIPIELLTVRKNKGLNKSILELDDRLYTKHSYREIDVPDGWVPFEKSRKSTFKQRVESYLYNRYSDTKDIFIIEKGPYVGMGAIGMYHGTRLIGFHVITGKKYVAHFDGNKHVLYMPDHYPADTTILVEGGMDARALPCTVACLGAKVTKEQAYLLKDKRVIMLPDRSGKCQFIEQFHSYGWSISIPRWKSKDLSEAVATYGKVAAMRMIIEGVETDPIRARLRYDMWTEDRK